MHFYAFLFLLKGQNGIKMSLYEYGVRESLNATLPIPTHLEWLFTRDFNAKNPDFHATDYVTPLFPP